MALDKDVEMRGRPRFGHRSLRLAATLMGLSLLSLLDAPAAPALDSVYWANLAGNKISYTTLIPAGAGAATSTRRG